MKPLLLAAALAALPAVAQAQAAAATLPNSFDRPAAQAPAQARPPVAAPAEAPLSQTRAHAESEATLRTLIRGAQAGEMEYALLSEDLGKQVREREAEMTPLIQGFGAVQQVRFIGNQNGVDRYAVTFANAATEWLIGFNEAGKVAALLFRPAE